MLALRAILGVVLVFQPLPISAYSYYHIRCWRWSFIFILRVTSEYLLVDQKLRDFFDVRLAQVLNDLPEWLLKLFDEVPLHVEDYPSEETLARLGIRHRGDLCGLHTGIPLVQRKVLGDRVGWDDPNTITIYREGIMHLASERRGHLSERDLLRQIRITVLHELGHYHGLNEADLSELGYG